MPETDITRILGQWEGYDIVRVKRTHALEGIPSEVRIELKPQKDHPAICDGCAQQVLPIHDTVRRKIRDLPILDAQTIVYIHRRRVHCPRCGPKVERVSWLDRYARVTKRLAESVAMLCQVMTIKHVANYFSLSWDTVKAIDKNALIAAIEPVDLSGIEKFVMDEFAIQKGHRYATVIAEPESRRVLWVGRGRGRHDVRPFFELLGQEGCARIRAVAIDMNGAYEQEVRLHCPRAKIVYDLFHVVAKYGREVIDRVRVDEANRLRHDKRTRKVVKGSRWLLLRNRNNVKKRKDRVRLKELLEANEALATVYVLKDDLKHLWEYRYPGAAKRFWQGWYERAMQSGIAPLMRFARSLEQYLHGILAHCQWPLHTSVIEGMNNKIKVIKRMAYGFRDDEYFFLKIKAAFPGIPR